MWWESNRQRARERATFCCTVRYTVRCRFCCFRLQQFCLTRVSANLRVSQVWRSTNSIFFSSRIYTFHVHTRTCFLLSKNFFQKLPSLVTASIPKDLLYVSKKNILKYIRKINVWIFTPDNANEYRSLYCITFFFFFPCWLEDRER